MTHHVSDLDQGWVDFDFGFHRLPYFAQADERLAEWAGELG